jgi:hypothetical protein
MTTKPTKVSQMINKSVWRFTEDTPIYKYSDGQTGPNFVTRYCNPQITKTQIIVAPKGEQFTVQGKSTTYYHDHTGMILTTLRTKWFTIEINKVTYCVGYSDIQNTIEVVDVPKVTVWVLRDKLTGEYYKCSNYSRIGFGKCTIWPVMSKTYSTAKKAGDIGKLKSSILSFSGYFNDLPGSENMPDWLQGSGDEGFQMPDTWEAVEFDKATKQEIQTVDIQTWYKRTWSLRTLTVKYGSAVRKVFGTVEKKGEIDNIGSLLTFQTPIVTHTTGPPPSRSLSYTSQNPITKEQESEITEIITQTGTKRGEYFRVKDDNSMAIAFKNPNLAVMARLAYAGDLVVVAYNMKTMQEETELQN